MKIGSSRYGKAQAVLLLHIKKRAMLGAKAGNCAG